MGLHLSGLMIYNGNNKEHLQLESVDSSNCYLVKETIESGLSVLWFEEDDNRLIIDAVEYTFNAKQIVCLTEFHKVDVKKISKLKLLRFNRPFYCIVDHDVEVGCKGILFFGASDLPVLTVPDDELDKLETVWKMFLLEMESKDNLQQSMLQMMLQRVLILLTRIYRQQQPVTDRATVDIIREFNFLVEKHYKTLHTVADYAALLHKSPKTIANIFVKWGEKTPLQFIQERKMLEARRLLSYTDKPVKEIADELGFIDIQTFSRFFKKQQGVAPSEFREKNMEGKIANS